MDDLPDLALTIIVLGVILFVGVSAVSHAVETSDADKERIQTAETLDGTTWQHISDKRGDNQDVYDSRGYGIFLSGSSDSYFQSESDISLSDSNWTVSAWAARANNTDMTALSIDGSLLLNYNATQGNYTAWYYDDGSRDSYTVSVDSQSPQNRLEHIAVVNNDSALTIYSNTTQGTSADLGTSSSADAPVNATSWNGTIDELRISSTTAWKQTTIQTHYSDPIDPLAINQSGRAMFDEPYRDSQRFFYQPGDVLTSNVQFVAGLPGSEMAQGTDYEWNYNPTEIRPLAGGELDGAPVAYVDYDELQIGSGAIASYGNALTAIGILVVLLPLGFIVSRLYLLDSDGR